HDELLGPVRVVGRAEREEPSFGDLDSGLQEAEPSAAHQPEQVGLDLDEPVPVTAPAPEPERKRDVRNQREPEPITATATTEPDRKLAVRKQREPDPTPATATTEPEPAPAREPAAPEEVLIINVVARSEEGFPGGAMLQSIMESGLRFGEMNIFHRQESMTGN